MPAATAARLRAGQGCCSPADARRDCACSTGTTWCPGRVRRWPEERRSSSGSPPAFRTARRTSRCSTWARPGCPATFARCCGTLVEGARRSSSTRAALPIRAGRARRRRRSTGSSGALCSAPTTCSTRASSASGRRTSSSASPTERGKCSTTPSTSSGSRRGVHRRTARRCSCSAATRRRRTGWSSDCARSPNCPAHGCSSREGWCRIRSRCCTSWGSRTVSSSPAGTHRATHQTFSGVPTCCCTRRCSIPVRASSSRRWPAGRSASRELGARPAALARSPRRCRSPSVRGPRALCGRCTSPLRTLRARPVARASRGGVRGLAQGRRASSTIVSYSLNSGSFCRCCSSSPTRASSTSTNPAASSAWRSVSRS